MKEARHKWTNTVRFHLYEVPIVVKFIKTERMVVTRAAGGVDGELFFNGYRVSVV